MSQELQARREKGIGMASRDEEDDAFDKLQRKIERTQRRNKKELDEDLEERRSLSRFRDVVWPDERKATDAWREDQVNWFESEEEKARKMGAKGRASKGAPSFSNRAAMQNRPIREDQAWKANEAFRAARRSKPIKYPSELPETYLRRLNEWKKAVREEVITKWQMDERVADAIFQDLDPNNNDEKVYY